MRLKELFDYVIEKLTAKLNQPLDENSMYAQTFGEMIYEASLYMEGE